MDVDSDLDLITEGSTEDLLAGASGVTAIDPIDPLAKRFRVSAWHAQALWAWDVAVDTCAICRNQIMDLCIECQANPMCENTKDECTVAWGVCNHAFHFHCISRWLRTRHVCPLDNQEWDYQRYGR